MRLVYLLVCDRAVRAGQAEFRKSSISARLLLLVSCRRRGKFLEVFVSAPLWSFFTQGSLGYKRIREVNIRNGYIVCVLDSKLCSPTPDTVLSKKNLVSGDTDFQFGTQSITTVNCMFSY